MIDGDGEAPVQTQQNFQTQTPLQKRMIDGSGEAPVPASYWEHEQFGSHGDGDPRIGKWNLGVYSGIRRMWLKIQQG